MPEYDYRSLIDAVTYEKDTISNALSCGDEMTQQQWAEVRRSARRIADIASMVEAWNSMEKED